ncbi:hypothetical protein A0H81_07972 [Grifola frondosa]|uniref:Aminotransferase class V domain-containing protein n=1 Tax=Grifola frondosa TaxID=5627 RepID=A0A1C7M6J2_GRIFR|nr:hypothetical protein A0H81_07972 [Grifola frondosa]
MTAIDLAAPFGHALKPYWAFDPKYINLNHGSYGSLPLPVLFSCTQNTILAERNPDKFHRVTYMPMLQESRKRVAELVGAEHDEIVLVPNATHGLNTVLRNFEWKQGDVIIGASTTYGAISRTIQYLADRSEQPRPEAYSIQYTFPMSHAEILDAFRARVREIKQLHASTEFSDAPLESLGYEEGSKKNKFVAVIDSVTANPGVLMPWKEMVRVCRKKAFWSVVDAAHSIGQETNINSAKRGLISGYPTVISGFTRNGAVPLYMCPNVIKQALQFRDGYDTNFVLQHEWTGTMDFIPYLSIPAALDFRNWLGGEAAINEYCHELAMAGGERLASVMGTKVMDKTGELTLNMTNVLLPLPVENTKGEVYSGEVLSAINSQLREKLLYEWNTYAAHYFHAGGWWCRCSAQVWNEESDFEYLGKAFNAICKEIKDTLLAEKRN